MPPANDTYFGAYLFEASSLALLRGMDIVHLPGRQLEVLALVLDAQGKVVTRQTLMDSVWRDLIVEEHNLTQTVFLLRRTLGKLPSGGEYIETVPRYGYRMSAAALRMADIQVTLKRSPVGNREAWWRSSMRLAGSWFPAGHRSKI